MYEPLPDALEDEKNDIYKKGVQQADDVLLKCVHRYLLAINVTFGNHLNPLSLCTQHAG